MTSKAFKQLLLQPEEYCDLKELVIRDHEYRIRALEKKNKTDKCWEVRVTLEAHQRRLLALEKEIYELKLALRNDSGELYERALYELGAKRNANDQFLENVKNKTKSSSD